MISQEDYDVITKLDSGSSPQRSQFITKHSNHVRTVHPRNFLSCIHFINASMFQCAKTFLNLMDIIAKDQTVQYILTLLDDMLQVRVDVITKKK